MDIQIVEHLGKLPPFWHMFANGSLHCLFVTSCGDVQGPGCASCQCHTPSSLSPTPTCTDQLVRNLVHDVGVIQSAALVLPPALDVDAGLLLKVWQVEVVPERGDRRDALWW